MMPTPNELSISVSGKSELFAENYLLDGPVIRPNDVDTLLKRIYLSAVQREDLGSIVVCDRLIFFPVNIISQRVDSIDIIYILESFPSCGILVGRLFA